MVDRRKRRSPGWDDYLWVEKPMHPGCPCVVCENWRAHQVGPGDLCIPFVADPKHRYSGYPEGVGCNFCWTWRHDGSLLWEYKPEPRTLIWCMWENPREKCDAHLDPITILLPDGQIRVTSRKWLEVIQKAPESD